MAAHPIRHMFHSELITFYLGPKKLSTVVTWQQIFPDVTFWLEAEMLHKSLCKVLHYYFT